MSRDTTVSDTAISRLRRPISRLRDAPIWAKLGLIMIVPTIATVIVGTNGLVGHIQTQATAERARNLATLAESAGQLIHNLQDERAAGTMLLAANSAPTRDRAKKNYQDAINSVTAAIGPYAVQRSSLSAPPANVKNLLDQIDSQLAALNGVRGQVRDSKITLSDAGIDYQTLLSYLLSVRDSAAHLAGDNDLNDHMRAAAEVSRIKDYMSERRVVVHQILSVGKFTPTLQSEYIATATGEKQAVATFQTVGTRPERELYEQTVSGSGLRKAESYEGYLNSQRADSVLADRPFDSEQWDTAMREQGELLRTVERSLDKESVAKATELRDDLRRQVLLETGLLLGMLLVAVLFAWLVARSMARSLRELKHGALAVAERGLPQAVSRLRDPALSQHLSPAQAALQIAEPLPVRSNDEFGQVTEAFNAVHLEAVRTAAEQAALRASVSTMFVNLARRSQSLVDRLIGQLDRLERSEEDPDRLGDLFQLDHLATRMRRNDENLLVLAGADSSRIQREPAALIDVLRAAQSEVEHYTRIDFGAVDASVQIAAQAVNDLVHLVAELFDNATAFSPPDSPVMVEAHLVDDQVVVRVIDQGIGISAELLTDLNRRLAEPPQVDIAVSRMMGLVVVARLAARHQVRVQLGPGRERGTVAEMSLPAAVLRGLGAPTAPAGGTESVAAAMARGRSDAAAQRGERAGSLPRQLPAWADLTGAHPPVEPSPSLSGFNTPMAPPTPPVIPTAVPASAAVVNGSAPGLPRREPSVPTAPSGGGLFVPRQATGPDGTTSAAGPDNGTNAPVSGAAPTFPAAAIGAGPASVDATAEIPVPPADLSTPPLSGSFARPLPSAAAAPMSDTAAPSPGPAAAPAGPAAPPVVAPPTVSAPAAQTELARLDTAPPTMWPPAAEPSAAGRADAAVEHTTELPQLAATAAVAVPDETMELPIFRELESVWFRARPDTEDGPTGQPGPSTGEFPTIEPRPDAGQPAPVPAAAATPTATVADAESPRVPDSSWRTAADDGWQAAQAIAEAAPAETTTAGLPKRTPMAQLVPGSIETESDAAQRRTPEGVRGLLSAYHRGVQRGRATPRKDAETGTRPTPAGQPVQAGKERDA